MTDGKIFRCPFSANVERLKGIPQADSDFFDIRGARHRHDEVAQIKSDLAWFLRFKPFLRACDSCNGRTYEIQKLRQEYKLEHLLNISDSSASIND